MIIFKGKLSDKSKNYMLKIHDEITGQRYTKKMIEQIIRSILGLD